MIDIRSAQARLQPMQGVAPPSWNAAATTKFRIPRLRPDVIGRPALLQRAGEFAAGRRLTLVCAPAGAGKSTLLTQLAQSSGNALTVWLSLDEDDNDANRLFASLLGALRGVQLEWEVDPQTLASQLLDAGAHSRAALGLLVNALCSFDGERLLLMLDDLHRITDADALQLLNHLIERLPPEVGMVVGTRTAPALALARLRSRGELGELLIEDLQFDSDAAHAFAAARLAGAATPELVQRALQRTGGWAAGLQLMFSAAQRAGTTPAEGMANRHLFDFLAHEVLAELPRELADFALQCAVLPELSPAMCNAVTGRGHAHRQLDELYRRNLFVTAIDESTPVLRFHDLFRDFLQGELERRDAPLLRVLHARAAAAESTPTRAVAHWLKAERWDDALRLLRECVQPLLAEGAHALVERWIAQFPQSQRQNRCEVIHLQGLCAFARWDWAEAARLLARAAACYKAAGDPAYISAIAFLPRAYNSLGDLEAAARVLDEVRNLAFDPAHDAVLHAARGWQALAHGEPEQAGTALQALADCAERDPALLFPAVSDLFNGHLFGLPGTQTALRRLRTLSLAQLGRQAVPWQIEAMAYTPWPELWRGDRADADAAMQRQQGFTERYSILRTPHLNACHAATVHAIAHGDCARAAVQARATIEAIDVLDMPVFSQTWRRISMFILARVHWAAQDRDAIAALLPTLLPERRPLEWPVVDMARLLLRGQHALLERRLDEAEADLREACRLHRRWRLPTMTGDPRLSLARLHQLQGDRDAARAALGDVLDDAVADDCAGVFLLEPRVPLAQLLELLPDATRSRPGVQTVLARIESWLAAARAAAPAARSVSEAVSGSASKSASGSAAQPACGAPDALQVLSPREREVLARIAAGDSNKLIARALDLSLHTVKRHVANILDKLTLSTRGQAAAWYRQNS